MAEKTNKEKIEELALSTLDIAIQNMKKQVKRAIDSGALNIDDWDINVNPMILPKIIVKAILEDEATQYEARGTAFEKEVKKEVKNLKLFI